MRLLWRFALCLVLSVTMLSASAPLALAGNEFGVLYTGNYDDADADAFRARMLGIGWRQEVWKTSNSSRRSMKPAHFHFTDGIDGRLTESGDDCDLLYISGHGWRHAKFPIYWSKGASAPYDSISADTNCVGGPSVHPWEVGVDWAGKWPSNESRWDYDIEWAIFAACNQLDYRTSSGRVAYSDSWPRNSSAKVWARTLLGEPGRMHAILGYWGTAPAGNHDVYVIEDFLDDCIDNDATVCDAWARANGKWGFPWAYVVHSANRNDRLHGQGAGATPDTNPRSSYRIDYYRSGLKARILDGRGGAYEKVSEAPGFIERASEWLEGTFGVESAHAARRRRGLRTRDRCTLRFRHAPHGKRARFAPVSFHAVRPDARRMRACGMEMTATVRPSGEFEMHSGRRMGQRVIGDRPMPHAVAAAKEALEALGPQFEDAEAAEVYAVVHSTLDLDSEAPDPEEVVQYTVRFVQRLDDAYVEGPGTGVMVTVDGEGVSDITGYWVDEDSCDEAGMSRLPVDPEGLALRRGRVGAALKVAEDDIEVRNTDMVYLADPRSGGRMSPAWRYELDGGEAFYLDAGSGEVMLTDE